MPQSPLNPSWDSRFRNVKVFNQEIENSTDERELKNVKILKYELKGSRLNSFRFFNTAWRDVKMTKSQWSHVNVANSTMNRVDLSGSTLRNVTFQNMLFKDVAFKGATLENVTFINCGFWDVESEPKKNNMNMYPYPSKLTFKGATLQDVRFIDSIFRYADFTHLKNSKITFQNSELNYVDMRNSELDILFEKGEFNNSDLTKSRSSSVIFRNSTLRNSNTTDLQITGNLVLDQILIEDIIGFDVVADKIILNQITQKKQGKLGFEHSTVNELRAHNINIKGLYFTGSIIKNSMIDDLKTSFLSFAEGKFDKISIKQGTARFCFLSESEINKVKVLDFSIRYWFILSNANIGTLKLQNVRFRNPTGKVRKWNFNNAQIENLEVKDLVIEPNIYFFLDGVNFDYEPFFERKIPEALEKKSETKKSTRKISSTPVKSQALSI